MRWLAFFTLVPLLDLLLLVQLSRILTVVPTVILTVATGVVGGSLAKREGLRVWNEWQSAMTELRAPEQGVLDGVLVLVGAVLLITPGVLTDACGTCLLLRPTRRIASGWIKRRIDNYLDRQRTGITIISTIPTTGTSVSDDPSRSQSSTPKPR